MKNKYNKLTCLFGHHQYSEKPIEDKSGYAVHLCKICKRRGYYKWEGGCEVLSGYDERGNRIHSKWDGKDEYWYEYDEKGNLIHEKRSGGVEFWYDAKGI